MLPSYLHRHNSTACESAIEANTHWKSQLLNQCRSFEDLNCSCWSPNVIAREEVNTSLLLSARWQALLLATSPKAGTSSMRRFVQELAPKHANSRDKAGGEDNCFFKCPEVRKLISSALPVGGGTVYRAFLSRDPLSRYLSGLDEMAAWYCDSWERFRAQHNRTRPRLLVASPPPSPPAGTLVARYPHRCSAFVEVVGRDEGALVRAGTPEFKRLMASEYLEDVALGFSNMHTDAQTVNMRHLAQLYDRDGPTAPAAPVFGIVHLEDSDEWPSFLSLAGLSPALAFPHAYTRSRGGRASSDDMGDNISSTFANLHHLKLFCSLFSLDYACMQYKLPDACRKP